MRVRSGACFFLAWVAIASTVHAAPRPHVPAAITMSHNVSRNGLHISTVSERFESAEGRYRIVSESRPVGVVALIQPRSAVLTSTGCIGHDGLQPERFEGSRGPDDPRRASAEFDWAGGQLALAHDGKSETTSLPAGAQDRLSAMYQFMFYGYGARELAFPMTNGRKLDHYRYTVSHDVEIETPLGRMRTLHLVKQRGPDDSETEIWLAPENLHLPVKMVIVESDGVRYEQVLTHIEVQP